MRERILFKMSRSFGQRTTARDSGGYQGMKILCVAAVIVSLAGCQQTVEQAPPPPATPPAQTQSPPSAAQSLPSVALHIDNATLQTEIAATEAQRERGLMFRTNLGDNDGMIFLMGTPARATFWMKNTLIPLSVAFVDKNGVILEIHDMTPGDPSVPDNQLPITRSDSDQVAFALETNLHWFALNEIKPGDKINPPPGTLANSATP